MNLYRIEAHLYKCSSIVRIGVILIRDYVIVLKVTSSTHSSRVLILIFNDKAQTMPPVYIRLLSLYLAGLFFIIVSFTGA